MLAVICVAVGCARKPKPAPPAAQPAPTLPKPSGEAAPPLTISNRSCGVELGRLTGDRVGAIRIGMTADSVKRVCRVVRDTVAMAEGDPYPVLVIAVGRDTLVAWMTDSGKVNTVHVRSSRFAAADSLRVGMPLGRLLSYPGMVPYYGEGNIVMFSDAPSVCGLTFIIDFGERRPPNVRDLTRETLEPFASSASIAMIVVRGCDRGR